MRWEDFRASENVEDRRGGGGGFEFPGGGGGGFSLPRYLQVTHPGTVSRVLELDPALVEIAGQAADGATVVVTTHGLAGRAGLCRLLGLPFELWRTFASLDNCAWSVLHRHRAGGYWRVAEHNVRPLAVRETIS